VEQVEREGTGQNVRSRELLCELKLSPQQIPAHYTADKLIECLTDHINYNDVNEKIASWRRQSVEWLKGQLEG
jgi:hypothetical protein